MRTVSAHAAGLPIGDNAFDVYAVEEVARDRDGREIQMTRSERAVAVRAIATMTEFAGLADSAEGVLAIEREARLIDPADPAGARAKLLRLSKQHQAEWGAFMSSVPERSWVREIVGQL